MTSITCSRNDERFEVNVHNCTEEDLQQWKRAFGVEAKEFVRKDGESFKTVEVCVGKVKVCLFS